MHQERAITLQAMPLTVKDRGIKVDDTDASWRPMLTPLLPLALRVCQFAVELPTSVPLPLSVLMTCMFQPLLPWPKRKSGWLISNTQGWLASKLLETDLTHTFSAD